MAGLLSTVLVRVFKSLGVGTKVQSPTNHVLLDIMVVLHVDDTDLMIMQERISSPYDLWHEYQCMTTTWGKLLLSTGGALKPEICFYYMVNYEWLDAGSWQYVSMVDVPQLTVSLADGSDATIKQRPSFML